MTTLAIAIDSMAAAEGARRVVQATDSISSGAERAVKSFKVLGLSLDKLLALAGASFSFKYMATQAMDAEKSQLDLAAALDLVGANTGSNMAILKAYATEMQGISRFEDDAILSQMAYAKNLGVQTTDLKTVTEAAIEMAVAYRKDLPSAMELVARASQGHTEMLQRMGITLDQTKSKEEQWIELKDKLHSKFDLISKDAASTEGALQQLKNAVGNTAEAIAQSWLPSITAAAKATEGWLVGHEADFTYWSGMATESIKLVAGIGLEFVQFMGNDWKAGIGYGLDASTDLFIAWGKSLNVIFEKIFGDIAINISTYMKRAVAVEAAKKEAYAEFFQQAKDKIASGHGVGGIINPPNYLEVVKADAQRLLDAATPDMYNQVSFEIPTKETQSWDAAGDQIKQIWKSTLDDVAAYTPPSLLEEFNKRIDDTTAAMGKLKEAHEAANVVIERTAQLQQFLIELYNNSSMGFEAFANAWDAISGKAEAWQGQLTAGTNEKPFKIVDEESVNAIKKATASIKEMFSAVEQEKRLIGLLDDERERAIELTKFMSTAEIAYSKNTMVATAAVDDYRGKLVELSRAKAEYNLGEMNKQLLLERSYIGKTDEERERSVGMIDYKKEAERAYGKDTDAYKKAVALYEEELKINQQTEKMKQLANGIGDAFGNSFEDMVFGAKSASEAMKALAMDVAHLVFRMTITIPIAQALSSALMSTGLFTPAPASTAGTATGPHVMALGGVFADGRLQRFAGGGIFDRPTLFPMANGAGLMGEAGPEAIMPLRRGNDGRLGVSASGGGGVAVQNQVNVYNQSGQPVQAKASETRFDGKKYVTSIFIEDLNTNGPITRSMQQLRR